MIELDYIVYKEGKYFVSQCININVSSFGNTKDEAVKNLKEAVELYLEDENIEFPLIEDLMIGKESINA